MSNVDWYSEWSAHHAAVFGLDAERDADTFAAWRDLFLRAKYTEAELREATDWLALNDPPKWRSEHLAAIQQRIRSLRVELRERPKPVEQTSYPDCMVCRGVSWVIVPHLAAVAGGVWNGKHTCAVLCSCPYGQKERDRHNNKNFQSLTLSAYERLNPGWLDQMEQAAAAAKALRLAESRASEAAEHQDRKRGPIHIGAALRARIQAMREKHGPS